MISFDWIEGNQMFGIKYLEQMLDEPEITERILKNLQEGIEIDYVLKNHIEYCKKHKITDVLPFALKVVTNSGKNTETRRIALETVFEISLSLSELEGILPDIRDDFKWDIIEQLVRRNIKFVNIFLRDILSNSNEEEKIKAARLLIELQDLEGLEYFVEWTKKHKNFLEEDFRTSSILSLRIIESLPFLIELLKINYQDDFVQDDFYRLDRIVLDTLMEIALKSEQNYIEVRKAIEDFIAEYFSTLKNVNFLNIFLEKLIQRYYINKSEKLDINDVIEKLKNIYINCDYSDF
jgi:hypothetical protein